MLVVLVPLPASVFLEKQMALGTFLVFPCSMLVSLGTYSSLLGTPPHIQTYSGTMSALGTWDMSQGGIILLPRAQPWT